MCLSRGFNCHFKSRPHPLVCLHLRYDASSLPACFSTSVGVLVVGRPYVFIQSWAVLPLVACDRFDVLVFGGNELAGWLVFLTCLCAA